MTVTLQSILTSNFCISLYIFILASLLFSSEHKFIQNLSFLVGIISFGFFCLAVRDTIWFIQYTAVETQYVMAQSGAEMAERLGIHELESAMQTLKTAFY